MNQASTGPRRAQPERSDCSRESMNSVAVPGADAAVSFRRSIRRRVGRGPPPAGRENPAPEIGLDNADYIDIVFLYGSRDNMWYKIRVRRDLSSVRKDRMSRRMRVLGNQPR